MRSRLARTLRIALPLIGFGALSVRGLAADVANIAPTYEGIKGEVLLDNPRVVVQKFVIEPRQSTGRHAHPRDQLLVFIKGGVLTSRTTGRSTLWREGSVEWQGARDRADEGNTNTGATAIEMICVTFKPTALSSNAPGLPHDAIDVHLNYPNIPGEDLFENSLIVVQRFIVQPGQWEGVHAHRPNMLYIHVKGGQWAARSKNEPQHAYPEPSPDGEVGWMAPIDISEGHESGNIGKAPIDLIWVTLKQ